MNKIYLLMTAALIITGLNGSPAYSDDDGHDHNHICFRRIDVNTDDKVTPEELKKFYPKEAGLFAKIDQDKDGSISHDEYEEYWFSQE